MAFILIDGVIANDTFATPASARTFVLLDGLTHAQFDIAASATAQPVDAVLGLTTWSVSGGAVSGTIVATQASNTSSLTSALLFNGTISSTQNSNTATLTGTVTSAGVSGTIVATQDSNTSVLTGVETFVGTLSVTQASNTASVSGTETYSVVVLATQADNQASITASETFNGSIGATQAANTASVSGNVLLNITGVIGATQAGNVAHLTGTNGTIVDLTWGPTGVEYYFLQPPYSLELATGSVVLPIGGSFVIPL